MTAFELRSHTADLAVFAAGAGFAEALAEVARGMFSYIADLDTVSARGHIEVEVDSTDPEALVVDWLNELLYRYETERFLPIEFNVSLDNQGMGLKARCLGETVDPSRHRIKAVVKAATYHGLRIVHNGRWEITVVLDV
ncbi:MAG: archease [SAR202 cluster bacterium]|nr:archease [SAR202 cluster bacterium]